MYDKARPYFFKNEFQLKKKNSSDFSFGIFHPSKYQFIHFYLYCLIVRLLKNIRQKVIDNLRDRNLKKLKFYQRINY